VKKIIETALPLKEINREAISERTSALGHPANLHMWWGRSPRYSSIMALIGAMLDAPDDAEELTRRLERLKNNEYADFGNKPTVFDPFSGYGGIPLAAQELGFSVVAGDLNPVAAMLTKAATEIPQRFAEKSAVNPESTRMVYSQAEGLAEDVRYYGKWMQIKVQEKLRDLYPDDADGRPAAWIWARTVKCPNPACGCKMPMVSSFVINSKAGREAWVEPIIENKIVRYEMHKGKCPSDKVTNKYGNYGAKFRCPACGELTSDEYVKKMGLSHQLGSQMMAMVIDSDEGRIYKAPSLEQEAAANVPFPDDIPQGTIPDNAHWFSPPGFGLTEYSDLFSARQMTMLTTFCDLLRDVQDKVASDALEAGYSPEDGPLSESGTGALAYGQAVSIYLAFVIDKMADRNTTVCTWNSSGGNPRATFGRQAIQMAWNYAEGNPFSTITGNFDTALKNIVEAIAKLPCGSQCSVYQGNAITAEFPQNVMICTELPYYKNIGYAHLSDFFYIWLRRSLKMVFPELFNQIVTSKEELSTVGQYYGGDQVTLEQRYRTEMAEVLNKMYTSAIEDYPSLLFFEYRKADDAAIDQLYDSSSAATAWEKMLTDIISVGFMITAIWPMRNEAYTEKADATRVLIVVRKAEKQSQMTRRNFINQLKRELPGKLDLLFIAEIDEQDRYLAAMGAGMQVFTQYKKILNADASEMSVHDALQIICQENKIYIEQRFNTNAEVLTKEG
jgi:putative DNA methylase